MGLGFFADQATTVVRNIRRWKAQKGFPVQKILDSTMFKAYLWRGRVFFHPWIAGGSTPNLVRMHTSNHGNLRVHTPPPANEALLRGYFNDCPLIIPWIRPAISWRKNRGLFGGAIRFPIDDPLPVFFASLLLKYPNSVVWSLRRNGNFQPTSHIIIQCNNQRLVSSYRIQSHGQLHGTPWTEQKSNSLAFLGDVTVTVRLKTTKSQLWTEGISATMNGCRLKFAHNPQ